VHADGVDIGAVQQRLVRAGVVGADPFDQLVLAKIAGPRRGLAGRGLGSGRRLNRRVDVRGGLGRLDRERF